MRLPCWRQRRPSRVGAAAVPCRAQGPLVSIGRCCRLPVCLRIKLVARRLGVCGGCEQSPPAPRLRSGALRRGARCLVMRRRVEMWERRNELKDQVRRRPQHGGHQHPTAQPALGRGPQGLKRTTNGRGCPFPHGRVCWPVLAEDTLVFAVAARRASFPPAEKGSRTRREAWLRNCLFQEVVAGRELRSALSPRHPGLPPGSQHLRAWIGLQAPGRRGPSAHAVLGHDATGLVSLSSSLFFLPHPLRFSFIPSSPTRPPFLLSGFAPG